MVKFHNPKDTILFIKVGGRRTPLLPIKIN
jgi:hypothetical protein